MTPVPSGSGASPDPVDPAAGASPGPADPGAGASPDPADPAPGGLPDPAPGGLPDPAPGGLANSAAGGLANSAPGGLAGPVLGASPGPTPGGPVDPAGAGGLQPSARGTVPPHPFLARVAAVPVVAILRAADAGRFLEVGWVLYEAGLRAVEVTLTSEGALEAFARLREELPADALLGVGTVRSAADAERAVEAGATYLIAPDFRPEMVSWAVERGVPVMPGALTPTEIAAAWGAGTTAVKVFPISAVGGPAYLKAVRAPLPEVPMVPTGGVGLDDIGAYLAAGAVAVGIGSPLLGDAGDPGGDLDALGERGRRAVAAATGSAR